jgi:hypothetical protein
MSSQSNDALTQVEVLRARAVFEGVDPTDADLEATAAFLGTILPNLRELEERLPLDEAVAALFHPDVP